MSLRCVQTGLNNLKSPGSESMLYFFFYPPARAITFLLHRLSACLSFRSLMKPTVRTKPCSLYGTSKGQESDRHRRLTCASEDGYITDNIEGVGISQCPAGVAPAWSEMKMQGAHCVFCRRVTGRDVANVWNGGSSTVSSNCRARLSQVRRFDNSPASRGSFASEA